jgi:hypothetical protein
LVPHYHINENLLRNEVLGKEALLSEDSVVIGQFRNAERGGMTSENPQTASYAGLLAHKVQKASAEYNGAPISYVFLPVHDSFNKTNSTLVAILSFIIKWDLYFEEILSPSTPEVIVVLENECQDPQTFSIQGESVQYLGMGDQHDSKFDVYAKEANLKSIETLPDGTLYGMRFNHDYCPVQIRMYPSENFYKHYRTYSPAVNAVAVAFLLLFTILLFLVYERLVEYRQKLVLDQALRSTAIVSSMFPKTVQDRLMNQITDAEKNPEMTGIANVSTIADFFPHATGKECHTMIFTYF